jgi:hypothetical protein
MAESKQGERILKAIAVAAIIVSILALIVSLYAESVAPKDTVEVYDYRGKVVQVDHVTTTTGGLFFTSTRTDTYVTFDNGRTYWQNGYQIIIEGFTYNVHTVETTRYGAKAFGNGTATTVENTFTLVGDVEK